MPGPEELKKQLKAEFEAIYDIVERRLTFNLETNKLEWVEDKRHYDKELVDAILTAIANVLSRYLSQ